ncbi:MAG: TonB family protein / TonB-dependent receptor, partial [Myxococcales bacterium]|nr:TonB family protein / TonB-dependent receptor [Myxococcales bacterium]
HADADRAPAQPLAGEVLSRGDRVPQTNVTVIVDDLVATTQTDASGHFVVEGLRVGDHVVHFRGSDFPPVDQPVTMWRYRPTLVTTYLDVLPRYVSHVRGRTVLQDAIEQTVTSEEIRHIPGTQGDTLKSVQNLPGVARPPFNGLLLAIWGSAPNDTRVYADGVNIPTLYHFGGLRSTVSSEMVQNVTLLPGGYDVQHGRGLGGAVEIETRDPRSDGIHGFVQADLIDVSGMVEGGLGRSLSFAAGFRISWLSLFLPAFVHSDARVSPNYWDYQLKLRWRASKRDSVDLFFFGSDDTLDVDAQDPNSILFHHFVQHTYYHRGLLRWLHRFDGGASLSVTPSVGYDVPYNLTTTYGNNNSYGNDNHQLGYSLRALYRTPLGRRLKLDAGVDYEGTRFTLDARQNPSGLYREGDTGGFFGYSAPDVTHGVAIDHLVVFTNHVAPFVALTITLFDGRLVVMPQLRVDVMNFQGQSAGAPSFSSSAALVEPRLAGRVKLSSRIAVHASLGVYHQAPDSADFSTVFGNPNLSPERGIHYVAGIEIAATPSLHIDAQGFYKDLHDLIVRGVAPADPTLYNGGVGRVYGGELLVRQELWRNFFGWVSYTLSRSERRDHPADPWRLFQYDQTHILTILGSYKLPLHFQVGLRFRYASGNPYTPVARAYYDVNSYVYVPIYGAPYSGRMPDFHQLDLRVDKTFLFNRWKLLVYLDVENLYNASSVEGITYTFDYRHQRFLQGLPFLPVLGARGEF